MVLNFHICVLCTVVLARLLGGYNNSEKNVASLTVEDIAALKTEELHFFFENVCLPLRLNVVIKKKIIAEAKVDNECHTIIT